MNKEPIINMITGARDGLVRTAQAVPEDKLNWKPLDNGRTVLDLLGEAAQTPALATALLRTGELGEAPYETFRRMRAEREGWTREECLQKLSENCDALFAALDGVSEDDLARPVTLAMGPRGEMTLPLGGWVMTTYRSFISRFAQINYIQTLYGDFDMH